MTAVQENIPLSALTTLGIGGPARYFLDAATEDAVLEGIEFSRKRGLPLMILGGGSNLLVSDEGFEGVVVRVRIGGISETETAEGVLFRVGAGVEWDAVVARSVELNLWGIECLSGIPGWVGGTPVQNVSAYGQEVSDVLTAVRVYDREQARVREMNSEDCSFAYRTSVFNTSGRSRYVVLAVEYVAKHAGRPKIDYLDLKRFFAGASTQLSPAEVRHAVRKIRASKAMLRIDGDPDSQSAGSFFKNPIVGRPDYDRLLEVARREGILSSDQEIPHQEVRRGFKKIPAAWLIEASGCSKGFSDGPVGLSSKHALAIVNKGGAKARDVIRFARDIQSRVEQRFGIRLATEPVFAGFPDEIIAAFEAVRA